MNKKKINNMVFCFKKYKILFLILLGLIIQAVCLYVSIFVTKIDAEGIDKAIGQFVYWILGASVGYLLQFLAVWFITKQFWYSTKIIVTTLAIMLILYTYMALYYQFFP